MDRIIIKPAGRQGYHVIQGERIATCLAWGEMLDPVIRLSAPFGNHSPAPFSMLTKDEWKAQSRRHRERIKQRQQETGIPF